MTSSSPMISSASTAGCSPRAVYLARSSASMRANMDVSSSCSRSSGSQVGMDMCFGVFGERAKAPRKLRSAKKKSG